MVSLVQLRHAPGPDRGNKCTPQVILATGTILASCWPSHDAHETYLHGQFDQLKLLSHMLRRNALQSRPSNNTNLGILSLR